MIHGFPRLMPVVLSCATLASTGLGGLVALRFRRHLHFLLGFGSGAVIAVALFDLLPEIFRLGPGDSLMPLAAVGFLAFFALERYAAMYRPDPDAHSAATLDQNAGVLSAGGLSAHSFLDGVAIGVGFRASANLGFLIATGIIAHDLSDGLNTVTVVLSHGNTRRRALFWLIIDMLAPVVGAATTLFVNLDGLVPWVLAFFAGSFLYIGAADLLPEAQEHDSPLVGVTTVIGMLVIFVTTHVLR
ncbi:MAG TPA: ZIP family metal transporter [Candidatus Binataceae bacterium]|nr:ZIP family metal transporter [Candidatus Binataceae bacterium]